MPTFPLQPWTVTEASGAVPGLRARVSRQLLRALNKNSVGQAGRRFFLFLEPRSMSSPFSRNLLTSGVLLLIPLFPQARHSEPLAALVSWDQHPFFTHNYP